MEDWYVPSSPGLLPPANRVLVFAPHPDDEVFGCGGVLALYAAQGVHVQVVVVTDGAAQVSAEARESHFGLRASESRSALACLGVTDVEFWGLPDRSLRAHQALCERMAQAIDRVQPQVLFAPSLWEVHPDHVAVGYAAIEALQARTKSGDLSPDIPTLLLYEVGAAQRVNLLVDIGPVWDAKQRAMACFVSQQARQDYVRHISALNVWRTYSLPADVRYAEGMVCLTASDVSHLAAGGAPGSVSQLLDWIRDSALARAASQQEQMRAQQEQMRAQLVKEQEALSESLNEFHAAMAQRDASIQQLQSEITRIKRSFSWRVTAPLRWLARRLTNG